MTRYPWKPWITVKTLTEFIQKLTISGIIKNKLHIFFFKKELPLV